MSTLTYVPVLNGVPYDPVPAGGTVLRIELFPTAQRTSVGWTATATRVGPGRYEFVIPDTTTGRFWPRVVWRVATAAAEQNDDLRPIDLPLAPDMVASPEELADDLRIPLPLTDDQRAILEDAIRDAQEDVVAYLGRPILPGVYQEIREWPAGGNWDYDQQPVLEVLSEAPELDVNNRETGRWIVLYRAGLDARAPRYRAIRRRVLKQAALDQSAIALWRQVGGGAAEGRRVTSMSTEGQSVSFEYTNPDGEVSSAARYGRASTSDDGVWKDIDRWSLAGRRVFERRTANRAVRIDDLTGVYG